MLVCPFTLVSGILRQSHVHLRLKLITQVTVLLGKRGGRDHYRQINKVLLTDPINTVIKHFSQDVDNPIHMVQGLSEWYKEYENHLVTAPLHLSHQIEHVWEILEIVLDSFLFHHHHH